MNSFVPVYVPWVAADQEANVLACLRENWISSRGRFVASFEKSLSDYTGVTAVSTCSNGTTALHLALLALGLEEGDEVLVPSFAYVAAVNAVSYVRATPKFVDIDPSTWNISAVDAEKKISSKTKAIICVHTYGVPCDLVALRDLADRHNLFLVEDIAEALGSFVHDRHVGTTGDICTFSFFGNKTITTGEGGAVGSLDTNLIAKVNRIKNQGLINQGGYQHDILGYNYRMTNIQSAIGLAQLAEVQTILKLKRKIANRYRSALGDLVQFQVSNTEQCSNWINTIKLSSKNQANAVQCAIVYGNIEFRPGFSPVNKMPMYRDKTYLPVTHELTDRLICLPSYPSLTLDEQSRVIEAIANELLKP